MGKTTARIQKDDSLECDVAFFSNMDCKLDSGFSLKNFQVAFKTFGNLNANKDNAILICHALTGDQYVSGTNPITKKDGWWSRMVGINKPIDTSKYYVICSNVIGGCAGTIGPKEINSQTNLPYGIDFPAITIRDMIKIQNYYSDFFSFNWNINFIFF